MQIAILTHLYRGGKGDEFLAHRDVRRGKFS